MAKSRSPRYPSMPLGEAISKAKAIYNREHMSPLSQAVAAEAMGYGGLNGSSLKAISSLRKYGLLEGRGDEVRISKDAQTLIIDDSANPDYVSALRRSALKPELFSELKNQFPTQASERNIAVYLQKQGFKPDAAALASKNFRDTMALVPGESETYAHSSNEEEPRPGAPMQRTDKYAPLGEPRPLPGMPSIHDNLPGSPALRVVMNGDQLDIQASVNLEGLKKLREMLEKYQGILEMMQPDKNEAAN